MTKAQGRRSNKHKGRYADRFFITERNKLRRAKKKEKIAEKRKSPERVARLEKARKDRYAIRRAERDKHKYQVEKARKEAQKAILAAIKASEPVKEGQDTGGQAKTP